MNVNDLYNMPWSEENSDVYTRVLKYAYLTMASRNDYLTVFITRYLDLYHKNSDVDIQDITMRLSIDPLHGKEFYLLELETSILIHGDTQFRTFGPMIKYHRPSFSQLDMITDAKTISNILGLYKIPFINEINYDITFCSKCNTPLRLLDNTPLFAIYKQPMCYDCFIKEIPSIPLPAAPEKSQGTKEESNKQNLNYSRCDVYIMHMESTSLYKIGLSASPKARKSSIQTSSPYKIHLLHNRSLDDAVGHEYRLHVMFGEYRKRGEWFDLNQEQVDSVIRYLDEHSIENNS